MILMILCVFFFRAFHRRWDTHISSLSSNHNNNNLYYTANKRVSYMCRCPHRHVPDQKRRRGRRPGGAKGSGRHTFGDTYAHIRVYAALVACRVIRFVTPKINMFLLGILRDLLLHLRGGRVYLCVCVFVCLCTCLRFSSLQERGGGGMSGNDGRRLCLNRGCIWAWDN